MAATHGPVTAFWFSFSNSAMRSCNCFGSAWASLPGGCWASANISRIRVSGVVFAVGTEGRSVTLVLRGGNSSRCPPERRIPKIPRPAPAPTTRRKIHPPRSASGGNDRNTLKPRATRALTMPTSSSIVMVLRVELGISSVGPRRPTKWITRIIVNPTRVIRSPLPGSIPGWCALERPQGRIIAPLALRSGALRLNPLTELAPLHAAFEVVDRFRDSFLEFHFRLPFQHLLRAGDVGLAHFRVVHREWLVFDLRFRPGDPDNFLGELFDRHLARVADVNRLVKIAHREPENSVD